MNALENQTDNDDIDGDIRALEPSLAHINEHLYAIFSPEFVSKYPDAWVEIAVADPNAGDENGKDAKGRDATGPKSSQHFSPLTEMDKAAAYAVRLNKQGANVYIGMSLRRGETGEFSNGRATKDNVVTAARGWGDFDKEGDDKRVAAAMKQNGIEFAELVITGTTPHPRFQLTVALDGSPTPDQLEAVNEAIRDCLGGNGDGVQNSDRVMRLAGTISYPPPKKVARGYVPELTKLVISKSRRTYDPKMLMRTLGKKDGPSQSSPDGAAATAPKTNRSFSRKVNDAALKNLSAWVPAVFGNDAVLQRGTGAYRVSSEALGRDREEDLSISPKGITDWGEDDMGKRGKRDARFTAIDIVIRYGGAPDATTAAFWLCKNMAIDPKAFGWKDGGADEEPEIEQLSAADAWDPWKETAAPRLDMSLLPAVIREAAEISAKVSGADVDAFAIGYLVGLTACADARLRLNPKMFSDDWSVPLVLWVFMVAPPASMKSEVIKAARLLAASLDNAERDRYKFEVSTAKTDAITGAMWGRSKPLSDKELERLEKEAVESVNPPRQRVCADITTEKLIDLLGKNPGGVSIFREELSGWLGSLGRYSNGQDGADRAFYCALRDGSPHDRQRMGKDTEDVHLRDCAGSFFGAVQMDRLRDMKLPFNDGLMQRFMPLIMRAAAPYDDVESNADRASAKALLRPLRDILSQIRPGMEEDAFGEMTAVPFRLDSDGAKLYQKFANDMRIAAAANYPSREFGECLQKMGPMWLSLALLLHLIEEISLLPEPTVPFDAARRADAIIRGYFIPHTQQFYLQISESNEQFRSLACAILSCPKDDIVLSNVVNRCNMMRGKKRNEHVNLMQQFELFGWLTRLDRNGTIPRWRRTKGLKERFAEELKGEIARRKALKAAIKADATPRKEAGGED